MRLGHTMLGQRPQHQLVPWLMSTVFLLPVLHPMAIPVVGVASHLLWFTHALPVAWWGWRRGGSGMLAASAASAALVVTGERVFGAGYFVPAGWDTTWALAGASAFSNLLVGMFATRARRALADHRALFDGVPIGVLRVDASGRVRLANTQAARVLASDGRVLPGSALRALLPDVTALPTQGDHGRAMVSDMVVQQITTSDGQRLEIVQAHLDGGDAQVLVRDVTEEWRLRSQLAQAQKLEVLGRFAGSIAHDFGNMLLAVGISLEMARDGAQRGDDVLQDLREAEAAVASARALTRQLLTFSRQQTSPISERIELQGVVRDTASLVRRLLRPGVQLRLQDGGRCGHVCANAVQLQQVLLNLAINANDAFVRDGTITIACVMNSDEPPAPLKSGGTSARRWHLLRVQDDGPGIPEALQSRIFEPFFTTKDAAHGTGLGLSTVASIVSQLQGEIRLQSRPGNGTQFDIYLPALDDEPA